jgi:cholesterol transport system auxiliary component
MKGKRMRSPLIALIAAVMPLAGCFGNAVREAEPARFDLGASAGAGSAPVGVAAVEVGAPSWLAASDMQYRLSYAEPTRRFDYADSRWVAPPAELLRQTLERRLAGSAGGHCRLRIELDEWVQDFAGPAASSVVLAGRAALLGSPEVLVQRNFSLVRAAPTADAKGGVAAAARAVRDLGDELAAWVGQVDRCR